MTAGKLDVAQQCLAKAKDYSGLLLMRRCVPSESVVCSASAAPDGAGGPCVPADMLICMEPPGITDAGWTGCAVLY
jgi:hypothetical protein